MTTEQLKDEALALPIDERLDLAQALWESLGEGLVANPEAEGEVVETIRRRSAELDSGTAAPRTREEVMAAARAAIGCE